MANSRLSIDRYGTPFPAYYQRAEDLFDGPPKNEVLNREDCLSKLLSDFKKLFEQTQNIENVLYDTILEIEYENRSRTEQIFAQRQLLIARSLYFEHAFSSKVSDNDYTFTEDSNGLVTIRFKEEFAFGLESGVLKEVIEYAYWGFWEARNMERTRQVFILAAKFDLKNLRDIAGEELSKNLTVQNVADFLVLAHNYEARIFKKSCLRFIIQYRKSIEKQNFEDVLINAKGGTKLIEEIYKEDVYTKQNS